MNSVAKDHTKAYAYLDAVADRLHTKSVKYAGTTGRNAELVHASVTRHCVREWDEAVVKALDAYSWEDVCAAVTRLKDGKRRLAFLETTLQQAA